MLKAEPYVYSQNPAAPERPEYGRARNSWLTGTASWICMAVTQWMLGIRPTLEGLKTSPRTPESRDGFSIPVEHVGRGTGFRSSYR